MVRSLTRAAFALAIVALLGSTAQIAQADPPKVTMILDNHTSYDALLELNTSAGHSWLTAPIKAGRQYVCYFGGTFQLAGYVEEGGKRVRIVPKLVTLSTTSYKRLALEGANGSFEIK